VHQFVNKKKTLIVLSTFCRIFAMVYEVNDHRQRVGNAVY
jgi:hypothetical protein